ncbi:MAG: hypothetical protein J6B23_06660, partial [Clostridia bacterium]|nr:hypothetical protein [Clostridia bacterium]
GACVETTYNFAASEGDTIVYTFKAATHRPEESDYQIYELEALGSYVEDVTQTGFAPETGFWYHNSNDAIDSYYINCNNAGDEDISGKLFIAAYNGNKLVKLTEAKDVTVKKGANTLSCAETDGIYDSTLTYKVFMWDGIGTLKPVAASADIR